MQSEPEKSLYKIGWSLLTEKKLLTIGFEPKTIEVNSAALETCAYSIVGETKEWRDNGRISFLYCASTFSWNIFGKAERLELLMSLYDRWKTSAE